MPTYTPKASEIERAWHVVDEHLTGLLVILPGAAAVAFAGVVLVTMVAAESFDPRMIWDQQEEIHE